jgi:hypothetical protein
MITPNLAVTYYTTVSTIGKPILDLLEIEYCQSCIETIQVMQYYKHWNYNLCNALKYLWRLGEKDKDPRGDLTKAIDYLQWARDDELNDLPETVSLLNINIAISKCQQLLKTLE